MKLTKLTIYEQVGSDHDGRETIWKYPSHEEALAAAREYVLKRGHGDSELTKEQLEDLEHYKFACDGYDGGPWPEDSWEWNISISD